MVLKSLKISNFRNYDEAFFSLSPSVNIIYGNNGEGKTNLLESIYFLAITKSHRSFIDDNLIKKEKSFFKLNGLFIRNDIPEKYEITYSKKEKKLFIDSNQIKKTSDFISNINVIIFYPEDLELIKGSPIERRRYLNVQISQLNKNYIRLINDYDKLLKQRNEILKCSLQNKNEILFNVVTESLIEKAIRIYQYRKNYIDNINLNVEKIYEDIANIKTFNIKYNSSPVIKDFDSESLKRYLREQYKDNYENEIKKGSTIIGPHKDDFEFYVENDNLKFFGSQGQQRLAIIAIKLSEIPIFKSISQTYPILLLDDVFSELDISKRNNLLKYITNNIQTVITTTDLSDIDKSILNTAKIIKIEQGNIIEEVQSGKN